MINKSLSAALLGLSLIACGNLPTAPADNPPLNSQRIENRFGSYGVLILRQTDRDRETCLYSGSPSAPVCRTIALVRFVAEPEPALAETLARVRQGASLGASLVADGWRARKVNRYIGDFPLEGDCGAPVARLLRVCGPAPLALHGYELRATRDGLDYAVANLVELHHPAYLDTDDVRTIYSRLDWRPLQPGELEAWQERLDKLGVPDALFN